MNNEELLKEAERLFYAMSIPDIEVEAIMRLLVYHYHVYRAPPQFYL